MSFGERQCTHNTPEYIYAMIGNKLNRIETVNTESEKKPFKIYFINKILNYTCNYHKYRN